MKNIKNCALMLFSLCLAVLLLVAATACNEGTGNQEVTTDATTTDQQETCLHEAYEWVVDKKATCAEEGREHKECVSCKAWLEELSVPTTLHTEEIIPGKSASCSETGLTEGKRCSVCETVLVEQQEIPMLPHVEEIINAVAATCTEPGMTSGAKCTVCGETVREPQQIGALGHSESSWIIDQAAEIGVDGAKHTKCTVCGETMQSAQIPAIEENHIHEGSEWIVVTPASCTEKGIKAFACDCGHTMETEEIATVPHTEEILPAKAATCMSTGLTEGKKCTVCNRIIVGQSVTAKAGHTEVTVLGTAPTCTASGLTDGKKCSVCTTVTVAQIVIPAVGHRFENKTCRGCGMDEPFGVWIVDGLGNPVSDIIVKVMKGDEQIKMYPYQGEFLAMNVEPDTYRIVLDLSQMSEEYVYDESLCTITPDSPSATIRLFKAPVAGDSLFVGDPILTDYDSHRIGEGSTLVTLTPNDYTFFVFAPTSAAVYTVTYECPTDLAISYHGGSFFVQGHDLTGASEDASKYENGISLNVYASNIGGEYVLAVKSTSATSCVINIKNVGDPGTRIEDAPWTPYLEDSQKVEEQLNMTVSGAYTTIDLTDLSIKAVYNEEDGYYHLNSADGPILFIDLTSDSQFVASIQIICGNQRMGTYVYDVNGDIIEKRSYNELFFQYGMPETSEEVVDSPIRVPLTEKLAEAIQNFGSRNGWWNADAEGNIFVSALMGAPYNREFAWLLYCGYYA